MIHKISVSAIVCALFAISMTAYAQGRPAGAGSQGGGRPAMSQQQSRGASMRQDTELRRQQSAARRLAAKADAAQAEGPPEQPGGDNNISDKMRMDHPPAATLPEEADLAAANADNAARRGDRRISTTGATQRDAETRVQGDDDDPDGD